MRHLLFNNTATVDTGTPQYKRPDQLPKGQIGVFDVDSGVNLNLTGANATAKMIIAQGVAAGKTAVRSNILDKNLIEKVSTKTYEAPLRQITHVGFNGVDGDIEAGAGDYLLKAIDVTNGYVPYPVYQANYFTENANVTPYTIAKNIARESARNSRFFVKVEALAAIATTASLNGATAVTGDFVHNSDKVTLSLAIDGLTVGDTLRVGHATDQAYPVYTVAAIDGTDITLDRVYSGETESGVALGDGGAITNEAAGLKLSGDIPHPDNENGIEKETDNGVTSFRTALSEDFGATDVRAAQAPRVGSGSFAQMIELERNSQGAESFFYRMTPFQADKPEFFADSDLNYDLVTVLYRTNTTENIAKSNKYVQIILAFKAGELAAAGADLSTFFGV